jgi:hypothetical protein
LPPNPSKETLAARRKPLAERSISFLLDPAEDWQQHGPEVFKRVRRESPAAYLKVCAMLVPREMKVEHQGRLGQIADEQLDDAIAMVEEMLARKAGDRATLIEGEAEVSCPFPPPK